MTPSIVHAFSNFVPGQCSSRQTYSIQTKVCVQGTSDHKSLKFLTRNVCIPSQIDLKFGYI